MKNQKTRVALNSVFGSIFLTIIKLIVGIVTGSMGIISEAAHNLSTKMEETVKQSLPNIERVVVHVEPKSIIKNS